MSKRTKHIAGCLLQNGDRLGLRRVEDRVGPTLLSSHLELHRGDIVLATDFDDIEARLRQIDVSQASLKWMLDNLREAARK